MKSPWLWIVGIIIALWIFLGEKSGNASVSTTDSSFPQSNYQSVDQQPTVPVPTNSPPTFMEYPCTVDCSGHEAGYEWAEENEIGDPDDCGGNSDSFIEGCEAYTEENQNLSALEATNDDE